MQKSSDIELRSEEVQEILGTPPVWLVRWGTTAAFVFFLVLVWASYWIRYPDIVKGTITVTSTEPPRKLYAEMPGYIARVLVRNEQTVDSGQVLLAFKSKDKTSVDDIMTLEDAMINMEEPSDSALLTFSPPRGLLLGDMQEVVQDFLDKQTALRQKRGGRSFSTSSNERQLRGKVKELESEISAKNRDKVRLQDQLESLGEVFSREQRLYQEKRITYQKLQETQDYMRTLDRERQGVDSDIKSKRFEITMLKNQIRGEKVSSREDNYRAFEDLKEQFTDLQQKASDWRRRYLVIAPLDGIVTFDKNEIADRSFLTQDAALFSIIPSKMTETTGRMMVEVDGSGRVDTGQQVIVKFKSFPFYEYGAVIGKVKWKGRIPTDKQEIVVEIAFPDGLTTTRNRNITPAQEMGGDAQIITSDKRLIQKIFENFRRLTSSG